MQIGIVGLGRMGGNIAKRLMRAGHDVAVYDIDANARAALGAEGARPAETLEALVAALTEGPRAIWVMLPAGKMTEGTIAHLASCVDPGDILIDGGNSYYKDDIRRAADLMKAGIRYVDVGTSGGVWGLERGYCLMIGGETAAVDHLDPIFAALAPKSGFEPMTAAATVSGVTLGSLLWWVFIIGSVTLFRHALGRRVRLWIDRLAGSFLMFFGVAEIRRGL